MNCFSRLTVRSVASMAFALVLLLASLSSYPLFAQVLSGRISGTITDPTGGSVPDARVSVINTDTQAVRNVTTDARGFYVAENLPIGPYQVMVEYTGFRRGEQRNLALSADGRLTADFTLQVGEANQTVEVSTARGEMINTVSGEVSHVIDSKQIDNLALNGRNYMELLTLVPGAIVTNPDQFSVTTSLSATNQVVNGHRSNSNNMTVDGVGNLDAGANGSLINNVSPDFTQEVKIQTSNFSAEYGRSAGVAFNIVTKNGTNQFHGGASEYFRNDILDARNFFAPVKTPLRYNDFGGRVGGPIIKNKLWFFGGVEFKRLRQYTTPVRETLPDTAMLNGDFSGTGKTVYLPGTKTPYANSIIPASQITADGRAIANVYRYAISQASAFSDTPTSNNATFQVTNPLNYHEELGRVDYRFNDKHSIYARYVEDFNSIYLPFGPSTATGTYLPLPPEERNRPGKGALLSETWVISPKLINEVRLGAAWNSQRYINQGDTWQRSTFGFAYPEIYSGGGQWTGGIPSVNVQNFAQFKGPDQTLTSPTTQIEFNDVVSIVKGQHTIRTGVAIIRNRKDQNGRSNYNGSIVFNTSGTPNTTGYAIADALLGNFQSYTEASYDPIGRYRYTEPAAFVDDSWKVSRKLTINLGLRYEYMMAMYSTADNLAEFVPSLYNPAQAVTITSTGQIVPGSGNIYNGLQRVGSGVNPAQAYLVPNANSAAVLAVPAGAPRGMYPSQGTWQPRVGFAFALNERTVVRSGYGLFYDRIQGNPTFYTLNNPPYVGSTVFNYGNLSNPSGGATPSAPLGTIQTIDPGLKIPFSHQFSFGIQRELPLRLFSEIDYVGTLGRHLLTEPDINQPYWSVLASVPSTTNENSIRPYAGYSTIQQFKSIGTSNYHSLQTKLTRRAGHVTFTAAYTWSKNLSDAPSDTENNFNVYNIKSYYGPAYSSNSAASIDVRHAFVGTFVWELPRLQHEKMYLRAPFGNWNLSGVIRAQSGFYYTVVGSTAILGTRVADYVGGPALLPNPGPNGWINPAAFAAAPQGRFGTSGAGNVEGPGLQQYNLSVFRLLPGWSERSNFRFQADFFNAFNNVNFQPFTTSSLTITNSSFGTLTSAYPGRNIQLAMKLTF